MASTKKEREIANRRRHNQEKQNRRIQPSLERTGETRPQREKILIVCDTKIITDGIFNILLGIDNKTRRPRQEIAIERAKKRYDNEYDYDNPANEESSTTVFRLVNVLNHTS